MITTWPPRSLTQWIRSRVPPAPVRSADTNDSGLQVGEVAFDSLQEAPASVSVSFRVLRWNSRTPRFSASNRDVRLTVADVAKLRPFAGRNCARYAAGHRGARLVASFHND
jgi:hypothetical protein